MNKEMLEFLFVGPLFSIFKKLNQIERNQRDMATQADVDALAARISAVGEKQVKAVGEVRTEVQALKDQIANLPTPVELDTSALEAAVANAESGAQELDDLNPDVPVEETPPADGGDTGTPEPADPTL